MYLISIYFDEKTDKHIRQFMRQVADASENRYMVEGKVPPHMTVSAFETLDEERVLKFISPVLNEYLHMLSVSIYETIKNVESINISQCYQPFQWIPHTTVGKKLSPRQMQAGFQLLQKNFGMFSGRVVKIGLAKTNPYRDIASWDLE